MVKRVKIIYNPTAGREQVARFLPKISNCLEAKDYLVTSCATTGPGKATEEARLATEQGYDLVVAAGGDGTIHEVVNGLAEQPFRPTLAVIPFGTTNDLANALGIPRSITGQCKMLQEAYEIPVDIGKLNNHRYFINIAAGGVLTELTYEVSSKLKTIIGQLAYYLKALEKLPYIQSSLLSIEYDGKLFAGEIMLFLIANSSTVGGFKNLAPAASLNDGLFDLLIIKKTSVINLISLVNNVLRGQHLEHEHLLYAQAKNIKISTEAKNKINLDGEYGGQLPAEFINLPAHLSMLVPNGVKI